VVAAAAARSTDGASALAAVGIGMSILVVVNTPALALTPLVATEMDRRSPGQLWRYALAAGLSGTGVLLLLALPPGSAAVHELFGLETATSTAVSAFLIGLAPNGLGVALRRYQHGRLIHLRRTGPIVPATVVRLVLTAAIAWTGTGITPEHGPLIAGCALTAGASSRPSPSTCPPAGSRCRHPDRVTRWAASPSATGTCPARDCWSWHPR
jgi:hypothetical protein